PHSASRNRPHDRSLSMSRSTLCALAVFAVFAAVSPASADDKALPDWARPIAEVYQNGKLFDKAAYRAARASFVQAFEKKYDRALRGAFGADYDVLTSWLAKNVEVKEEFFTAIDEKHDNVSAALRVFHDLWNHSPAQVAKYPALAIATAVVWD